MGYQNVTTTPEERPSLQFAPSKFRASHVQQPLPNQLTDLIPQSDIKYLQVATEALLSKIERLRTEGRVQPPIEIESSGIPYSPCYPMALPFLIESNVFLSKIAEIPVTVTERKLQLNPIVPMPNGNDPYTSIPTKVVFELGRIWTCNLNTELPQAHPPVPTQIPSAKKVHWDDEPTVLLIEPDG